MQIVIDIDEEVYTDAIKGIPNGLCQYSNEAIRNGTPLPKGHGELIDKDVVLDMMNHGILEEYITTMSGVIHADR